MQADFRAVGFPFMLFFTGRLHKRIPLFSAQTNASETTHHCNATNEFRKDIGAVFP